MDIENADKPSKVEEKKQQWESFVKKAKTKTRNHTTMVRFYNSLYNSMILSVILISGILTCVILLGGIEKMVLAALGGSCTVLTATSKFLVADRKKAGHKRSAKLFQTLLIRMLRCETLAEYNTLWHELQEAIIREPLVLIWRRRSKKTKISYIMAPRLEQVFEGKVEEPVNPPAAHPVYRPPMNYKPNEFNPHDFHVMSMNNGHPNHQSSNREDGCVGISGFHESQKTRNNNRQKSKDQLSEEKMPLMASSKTKKKKTKTDSEKSTKSSLGGNSSQGTLDDIEEQDYEEQESILGTRESLTEQRKGKQKKGQTNRDLPPPPPAIEEDEDEQETQQTQIGRNTPISSKNFRSTLPSRNDRSIIYDEEEENELSEDTDDLDENGETSYPRN